MSKQYKVRVLSEDKICKTRDCGYVEAYVILLVVPFVYTLYANVVFAAMACLAAHPINLGGKRNLLYSITTVQ